MIKRYRYDMIGAHQAGVRVHPEHEIKVIAPDAFAFEPVSIADCWLFCAPEIAELPAYVSEVAPLGAAECEICGKPVDARTYPLRWSCTHDLRGARMVVRRG